MAQEPILEPIVLKNNGELDRSPNALTRKVTQKEKDKERNRKSTAKQQASKSGKGGTGPLEFLKTTNYWLENVPLRIIAAFENFIGDGERAIQSRVDIICAWLAWKVNIAIERKRQAVLRILYGQYEKTAAGQVMKVAGAVQSFCSDPIGAVGDFANALFAPIVAVFKWITDLISEILKLAANLAKIMSVLPPTPPSPRINYDKFKLKVGSISLAEVMSDPSSLPAPEVMFPEPEKPFSKEAFTKGFETASANLKSMKVVYKLNEDDKKTLEAMNKDNVDIKTALGDSKDLIKGMIA
jgi:hypothetical protein